jgi:hypothetical protein
VQTGEEEHKAVRKVIEIQDIVIRLAIGGRLELLEGEVRRNREEDRTSYWALSGSLLIRPPNKVAPREAKPYMMRKTGTRNSTTLLLIIVKVEAIAV